MTHYTSHEDSPVIGRTAYTEVDPEILQWSDDEGEEKEETPYTTVEISVQSIEDLCRTQSSE